MGEKKILKNLLEELAKSVGNMTYNRTADFIKLFADNIHKKGDNISDKLYAAEKYMRHAWEICEPYTSEEIIQTKHPREVEGFEGSLENLVKIIVDMPKEQIDYFIGEFAYNILRQGNGDFNRGRTKLSTELYSTADYLYGAKKEMLS